MRALRGLWWLFGFSAPVKAISPPPEEKGGSPKERQCRTVRKRLRRATRLLLAILPRRIQSALGYPVCTSIGCAVSPGAFSINVVPVNPCARDLMMSCCVQGAEPSAESQWPRCNFDDAAFSLLFLEVRCSPTKPCGKGSKRKQDDLDEEDEAEQQSWVEALTQELAEEDHGADPDYEVWFALQAFHFQV